MKRIDRISLAAVLLLLVTATAHADRGHNGQLRVMTQNLYIGADVTSIIDTSNVAEIPVRVHDAFSKVDASNFESRAEAFVEQVRDARPDVIGLQEVSLIRVQEVSDFMLGNPVLAEEVHKDYLEIVMDELADEGLRYEIAGVVTNVDSELPAFGALEPGDSPSMYDLRLTDRDVILVRKGIDVSEVMPHNFTFNIYYSTPLGAITYTRGAIAIKAEIGDHSYRVINTHLEVRFDDEIAIMQAIQMQELLGLYAGEDLPMIVMGDLNSDPLDTPDTLVGMPTPYQQMLMSGFTDLWEVGGEGNGFTCCRSELLDNLDEPLLQRIDYIFVKDGSEDPVFSQSRKTKAYTFVEVTDEDRWYSDHDGVFAKIKLPRPERRRDHDKHDRENHREHKDHDHKHRGHRERSDKHD
ncbi:MAG: endonuclease/exonuclease/phosphatase family protein [Gammaproteobacteria bacterium]|nr:endonuclease/exonuclease/phosphatase family protein [Gammaproteobacteria bacterium]